MTEAEAIQFARAQGVTGRVEYDNFGNSAYIRSQAEQMMMDAAMRRPPTPNPPVRTTDHSFWQAIKHGARIVAKSFLRSIGFFAGKIVMGQGK